MNFVEWPGKNQFIPLPGDMKVIRQTDAELEIAGALPKTDTEWDRRAWCLFTASSGRLDRNCRVKYSCSAKKSRWNGVGQRTEYVGRRGRGGIRKSHTHIGHMLQDMP